MKKIDERLLKLIKERENLLRESNTPFLIAIAKLEVKILKLLRSALEKFSGRGGKLSSDRSNTRLLIELEKKLKSIFSRAGIKREAEKMLASFNKIDRINKSMYGNILGETVKLPININKSLLRDQVLKSFSSSSITANFIDPLKRILFEGIKFNKTFKEVRELVEQRVGRLSGYSSQVTRDVINRYDGAINDQIRDKFQLDGFMYVGALVENSRQNCIDCVNGIGRFAEFAISAGLYAVADIPKMIEAAFKGKGSGYDSSVTESNFASIRWGFGCTHSLVYVPLLESEIPERLKDVQKTANKI